MAVEAPYARIRGRVVGPAAPARTVNAVVRLTYEPRSVTAVVEGQRVYATRTVAARTDAVGNLVNAAGDSYLDVIAPGDGSTPSGTWRYLLSVKADGYPLDERYVTVEQGKEYNLADLMESGTKVVDNSLVIGGGGGDGATVPASGVTAVDNQDGTVTLTW